MQKLSEAEKLEGGNSFAIGIDQWRAERLSQLESIIEIEIHSCSARVSQPSITAATRDLGNLVNGEIGLYL